MPKSTYSKTVVTCAITLLFSSAFAQSPSVAKPAAKASVPATSKAASRGIMTRDELRACMKLQADLKAFTLNIEQRKQPLEQEFAAIEASKGELGPLRSDVAAKRDMVMKADVAVRDFAVRIEKWNDDIKEAEESKMRGADRQKKELERQRATLDAENKALVDTRAQYLKQHEDAGVALTERAKRIDAAAAAWNTRNQQLIDDVDKLAELQVDYGADCSSRKFREEDEAAIKQGK